MSYVFLPSWIVSSLVKFLYIFIYYSYNIIFLIYKIKKGATTRSQWSQLVKVAWPESAQAHYYRDPSKPQENKKSKSINKCLYFIKSYLVILKTLFIINIYWLFWNSELWDNNLIVLFAFLPFCLCFCGLAEKLGPYVCLALLPTIVLRRHFSL